MTEITYINGRAVEVEYRSNGVIKYHDRPMSFTERKARNALAEQEKAEKLVSYLEDWKSCGGW